MPRDQQEFESRRQQIIEGALDVFARKGFEKATNKEIAEAAGIGSPGLIYHYFKDKADLFRQVIEERTPALQLVNQGESLMELPPRDVLTRFARALVETVANRRHALLFKLLLGEALRRPAVAGMINSIGPSRGFAFISTYLERQMERGLLRRRDPGVAARCFIGPVIAYVLTREVFPQPDTEALEAETMIAALVDIFLRGLEPHPELIESP